MCFNESKQSKCQKKKKGKANAFSHFQTVESEKIPNRNQMKVWNGLFTFSALFGGNFLIMNISQYYLSVGIFLIIYVLSILLYYN